jgi:subtilase family serine protease
MLTITVPPSASVVVGGQSAVGGGGGPFTSQGKPGASGMQTIPSPTGAVVSGLTPVNGLAATQHLRLAISLPLRNQKALDAELRSLYFPKGPGYRKFLTPAQFTGRFGPSEANYEALIRFARKSGLVVTGTHSNRMILDVDGAVPDIEKTFHLQMEVYQHRAPAACMPGMTSGRPTCLTAP